MQKLCLLKFHLFFIFELMLKEKIALILSRELPGLKAHSKLLPPGRVLEATPDNHKRVKSSSVLLLLFEKDNILKVLLIKRPQHMKHHPGQIALPGGRIEINESAVETALRETYEEIGIGSDKIEILGELSEFYIEVSHFKIRPLVGWLKSFPVLKINPGEVEKIIYFPIEYFKPPYDKLKLETLTGKLDVPCVQFEKEIIWGATAMILSEFYDVFQAAKEITP